MNENRETVAPKCLADQLWLPFRLLIMVCSINDVERQENDYLQNPLLTALVFIVTYALFLWSWFSLSWLAEYITRPGVLLLIIFTLYGVARLVALIMSYPGHLRIVLRDTEKTFGKLIVRRLVFSIDAINSLTKVLSEPRASLRRRGDFIRSNQDFRYVMDDILFPLQKALRYLKQEEQLNSKASGFMTVLDEVIEQLQGDFMQKIDLLSQTELQFFEQVRMETFVDDPSFLATIKTGVKSLQALLPSITPVNEAHGFFWTCKTFWSARQPLDAVANLDLLRADLAVRYDGQQVWIPNKNHQIDAMFIPASGQTTGPENTTRTVILCNPNAGLYEFHHLQADWISFYTEHGNNVLVFNYRGYGRNGGWPSPEANNSDGEAVVAYLKNVRKITRLAAHGESIGGMVATHIARTCNEIELLVADRTFANLPAVAQRLVANWAGRTLSVVTRWKTDNVSNYLDAKCYKIVCTDPNDEIIADASSLKAGIALRLELNDMETLLPKEMVPTDNYILPEIGNPLTDDMVAGFYQSLRLLAARATASSDPLSVVVDVTTSSRVSGEDFLSLWHALASIDGSCGQTLVQALARGYEGLRTWISSLLVWGGSSLDSVAVDLKKLVQEKPYLMDDKVIQCAIEMILYLHETLSLRESSEKAGHLLPLSCGHNQNHSSDEKARLTSHLRKRGWTSTGDNSNL